jgi:hypothetical protein
MRAPVALVGGLLVAGGGVACAVAWTVTILADSATTSDRAFIGVTYSGIALTLGAVAGFTVLPSPWNIKAGGVAASTLTLLGALTLFAYVGFVIMPLGVLCVAAAAHASGPPLRVGGLLLFVSIAVYAGGALALEWAGDDGAYAVKAFAPVFALSWMLLGYGFATAGIRLRPASAGP